jgi:hypothetical protein
MQTYVEDSSNYLEHSELLCTPDIAEGTARETNWYGQTFLEKMSNLKLRSRTHQWTKQTEIK